MPYNNNLRAPDVRALDNGTTGNRGTRTVKLANSSVHYIGEFFDPATGTDGAQTFTANQAVRGVISDIKVKQGANYLSLGDVSIVSYPGTHVAPTATTARKYTASSDNVTVAKDYAIYHPLEIGDRVVATYGNGSGAIAVKGTTTGSDKLNYFCEPDPNYPDMILESGVNASASGLCFKIVDFPQNDPTGSKVILELINATGAVSS